MSEGAGKKQRRWWEPGENRWEPGKKVTVETMREEGGNQEGKNWEPGVRRVETRWEGIGDQEAGE